jgi:hypothetical protein
MRRRAVIQGLSLFPVALLPPSLAQATLVAGLTLRQLTRRSEHVVVVRSLDSISREVTLGDRQCLVTDTLVEVSDVLSGKAPTSQLTVRTLGGRIGRRGELVLGQPRLSRESRDVAFLTKDDEGNGWFVGMAQGHFPLHFGGSEPRLQRSRELPEIRDFDASAVRALDGRTLSEARRSVTAAGTR